MSLDLAKYRTLFLEEAPEHLADIGRALLELEKDPASAEAIDQIFRMAHSIKSMAASLGYDDASDLAHRIEDHMEAVRAAGRVDSGELDTLFRGLDGLERMVQAVRDGRPQAAPKKKLRSQAALILAGQTGHRCAAVTPDLRLPWCAYAPTRSTASSVPSAR